MPSAFPLGPTALEHFGNDRAFHECGGYGNRRNGRQPLHHFIEVGPLLFHHPGFRLVGAGRNAVSAHRQKRHMNGYQLEGRTRPACDTQRQRKGVFSKG